MKKIIITSFISLAALSACNEDYSDQFNIVYQVSDIKNMNDTLDASEYGMVADNKANVLMATEKDPTNLQFLTALESVKKNRYFNSQAPAEDYIPAYLDAKFPNADIGSKFVVTYNEYEEPSQFLSDFGNISGYTLSEDDYKSIWGSSFNASFVSPSSLGKIPNILAANIKGAQKGDMYVVSYAYSQLEPSSGADSQVSYDKLSDVIANKNGADYNVKGQVLATYGRGFLLGDGTASILAYLNALPSCAPGDIVTVSGTTSSYSGLMQFPSTAKVDIVEKAKSFSYPSSAPSMSGAEMDDYMTAPVVKYVSLQGTLAISGNYYNLTVQSAQRKGSISYPVAGVVDASLNGKDVVVKGYLIGGSAKYVNIMAVTVTDASANSRSSMSMGKASYGNIYKAAATVVTPNSSALYVYSGTQWKLYSTSDAMIAVVTPQVYSSIGSSSISSPQLLIPQFLSNTFPYAESSSKAVAIYKDSSNGYVAKEYVLNGTWTPAPSYLPVTMTFVKDATGISANMSVFISESFLGDGGGFTPQNVTLGSLSYVWINTGAYGWKASAFMNNTNNVTDSYLISPSINLKKAKAPIMTFDEAHKYLNNQALDNYFSVLVSTDYKGDATACTWKKLSIEQWSDGTTWDYTNVGEIDLSEFIGNKIYLAFRYVSDATAAPTWEVKNLIVKEKDAAQ